MSLSPLNIHIVGPQDIQNEEAGEDDDDDEAPPQEKDRDQNWLTIRRRCELCKQRKVRLSSISASFAQEL